MPLYVYIIYSPSLDQYDVGYTENLQDRIFRQRSTKKANDRVLKFTEEFAAKSETMKKELEIKSKKSRKYIERLVSSVGQSVPQESGNTWAVDGYLFSMDKRLNQKLSGLLKRKLFFPGLIPSFLLFANKKTANCFWMKTLSMQRNGFIIFTEYLVMSAIVKLRS